jgi:cellobiose-specific phosphotransferase system component IIA
LDSSQAIAQAHASGDELSAALAAWTEMAESQLNEQRQSLEQSLSALQSALNSQDPQVIFDAFITQFSPTHTFIHWFRAGHE